MAANNDPIFSRTPDVQLGGSILGPTAVTANDGTGLLVSIFQADATEGGYVDEVLLKPVNSPAATVARVFLCSVVGAFTSNTSNTAATANLIREFSCPAFTLSQTNAQAELGIPVRKYIPAGWRILIGFGTSTGAAGTGYAVTTFGGKL